jgi:mannosyltransferase PIG-V
LAGIGACPGDRAGEVCDVRGVETIVLLALLGTVAAAAPPAQVMTHKVAAWLEPARWPIVVYCGSRLVLLLVATLATAVTGRPLAAVLSLFDGQWYLRLARHGYPAHAAHAKSTLGFLPAYPLLIRGLAGLFSWSLLSMALVISFSGGLVAAVLVERLAAAWWGERVARRSVLVFCLFPGSAVFSMVYSESLTLPLVLACLLALRSGRWAGAGVAAGLATAVEPAAVILFPVCLAVAWRRLACAGWHDRAARRSLLAPLFAPAGLGAFAVYLWARTGTPFAAYEAQHYGWHQGDPFALLGQPIARRLIAHPSLLPVHLANLSLWNGILGSAFLVCSLLALARVRDELSPGAMLWACGVGAMTVWSMMTLANARMLLIAFPAVIVWARMLTGRRFALFLAAQTALFLLASGLTFAGLMLP